MNATNKTHPISDKPTLAGTEVASVRPDEAKECVHRNNTTAWSQLLGNTPYVNVRMTANIRKDLHHKLKLAAANRHITIADLLEELVDMHL